MMLTIRRKTPSAFEQMVAFTRAGGLWVPITNGRRIGAGLLGSGSVSTSLEDYPQIPDSTSGSVYVDGSAPGGGDGSFGSPFNTIQAGLAALSNGGTMLIRGGTYALTGSGITRSASWASPTYVKRYGTERVVIDGTGITANQSALTFSGSVNEIWHGIEVFGVPAGVNDGQAVRFNNGAHDCKLSRFNVHHCGSTGIYGFTAYNIEVLDSYSWAHGPGTGTGDTDSADAFAFTGNNNGGYQGIKYIRCAGAYCQDDIFDFFRNANGLAVDCVAYKPGYNWDDGTFASGGDGNGYKMGSSEANTQDNRARGCLAIGASNNGFDDNNMNEGMDLEFCTAINCGNTAKDGFGFQAGNDSSSIIKNNIGWTDNRVAYVEWSPIPDAFNSWNQGQGNPLYADPSNYDWSLLPGSPYLTAGEDGVTMGASDIALLIAKEFIAYVEANR